MKIKKSIIFFVSIILMLICSNKVSAKTYECLCTNKATHVVRLNLLKDSHNNITVWKNGEQQNYVLSNFEETFDFETCSGQVGYIESTNMLYANPYGGGTWTFDENNLFDCVMGYDLSNNTTKVSCGTVTDIPVKFPELTSMFIIIIQIAVPVVLVIMGMMDLFKGVMASKEDEIKKGQQLLIKRLIVAALIFFVIVIVKLLISLVADSVMESNSIVECMDCFLSGTSHCNFQ